MKTTRKAAIRKLNAANIGTAVIFGSLISLTAGNVRGSIWTDGKAGRHMTVREAHLYPVKDASASDAVKVGRQIIAALQIPVVIARKSCNLRLLKLNPDGSKCFIHCGKLEVSPAALV